jgi:hypothetical protein
MENVCTICDKDFLSNFSLIRHAQSHEKQLRYKCKNCPKEFYAYATYAQHRKFNCGNGVYSQARLGSRTNCDLCGKEMLRKHLHRHKSTGKCSQVEPTDAMTKLCEVCGVSVNQYQYKVHLAYNHPDHESIDHRQCEICGLSVPSITYGQHLSMKHKPKQNKSCLCPEYNVIKLVPHSTI